MPLCLASRPTFLAASASLHLSVPSPGPEHSALKGDALPESTSVDSHCSKTMEEGRELGREEERERDEEGKERGAEKGRRDRGREGGKR